jgi:uncharacterized protein (TIGR00369 family)
MLSRDAEERRTSPFIELIGAQLEEWREGYVRMSLELQDHHTNPNGVMHGGVVTTLMDDAIGGVIASVRGLDEMFAAPHLLVEMNTSFLAAARPGDTITVEAKVLKLGRRVAFGEAETRRGDGELVALGRMAFVILDRKG